MSVGIVRYPGSNCDFDTLRYFDDSFFIWHTETEFPENMKLLVIPGGFAFGDRVYNNATDTYIMNPGKMAVDSPVTTIIEEAVNRKIPILGICNGFQILIQLGLLPGELLLNKNKQFTCKKVKCAAIYPKGENMEGYNTNLYIANSYGRYNILNTFYQQLKQNNQIFLYYNEKIDEVDSFDNVAGICNKERRIFGMMPHPERNNTDFKHVLNKILFPENPQLDNQFEFHIKIIELMHSEHISYKSTRQYLKQLYTTAPWVVQGPGENAGIVDIGDGYCIAIRIESHNHPTFINPFEGAATGVGGILRDIFTMGARPIAILDFLRFGTDSNSKRLLADAIDGISYYGNCVGVPNIGGDCFTGATYNKNPLVNVACIGIVKKENIVYGNATDGKCDYTQSLIYIGSKTGNEGIGGAAMASTAFNSEIDVSSMQHNVQKSDPYLEKLLLEACCEIADKKLVIGMQDMGAGGLLCATYEVINRGREKTGKNLGCKIFLNLVPTKYDMEPCNILISESQERMLIIAEDNNIPEIFEILKKWDLEHKTIGITTLDGNYSVHNYKDLLYNEKMTNIKDINENWDLKCPTHKNYTLTKMQDMSLWKVYDSTVGNRTIKGPDLPKSYAILDIHENNKKLIVCWDEHPQNCYRTIMELQGKPLCIVNCLNYGHPRDSMLEFVQYTKNLSQFCRKENIPVVGGNVSLYNSTDDVSIKPTPIIVMIGLL